MLLSFYLVLDTNEMLNSLSNDTLYDGRLTLLQPQKGYRVSVDALLLTYFATLGKPVRRCADLGAGCGAVGIGLLLAGHTEILVAVETQDRLSTLALRNARLNGCHDRYELIHADIRHIDAGALEAFDLVVCNPPFWPTGKGRPPADQERRIACQEILGTIDDWAATAARLSHPKRGRSVFVYPSRRIDDFFSALRHAKLSCSRLRFVHPIEDHDAELFLAEMIRGQGGRVVIEPPIILKHRNGRDTDIAIKIMSGAFSTILAALPDHRPLKSVPTLP